MEKQNQLMQRAYVAISNALNTPDLLTPLSMFTYDEKKLREGLRLYNQVKALTRQRDEAYSVHRKATRTLNQVKDTLKALFMIHQDTARLAYRREAGHQDTLKLTAARKNGTTDWLEQAERFYTHIPVAMMEKYNVSKKELEEAGKMAQKVMELLVLQTKADGQSQQLNHDRKVMLDELKVWMRRLMKAAQLAFDDSPQRLEALNRMVRA